VLGKTDLPTRQGRKPILSTNTKQPRCSFLKDEWTNICCLKKTLGTNEKDYDNQKNNHWKE
jgi:hypothetical protein